MDDSLSLQRAREYLLQLPQQLGQRLDETALLELGELIARFEDFFNIASSIDRHAGGAAVDRDEASEICDFAFLLLGKLLELSARLDLADEHHQIEQLSLAIMHWAIRHGATVDDPEPVVNAISRLAAPMRDRDALLALAGLLDDVVERCTPALQQGQEEAGDATPWRDLHICRCEVALHSGDPQTIRRAFDEFLLYLPRQAREFFAGLISNARARDYPPRIRELVVDYLGRASILPS